MGQKGPLCQDQEVKKGMALLRTLGLAGGGRNAGRKAGEAWEGDARVLYGKRDPVNAFLLLLSPLSLFNHGHIQRQIPGLV